MAKSYSVQQGDSVLLVGEGNFSFTKDFLTLSVSKLGSEDSSSSIEIVTTCRETLSDSFSEFKQNNIKHITSHGATVIFNVDATSLKCHPSLQNKKFTKIIFNFPHVGGKMKINLNRKLLKDFFASACDVLDDNGHIIVALCDGQGGTAADKKIRRWDDTWQITEMAAQANLILLQVEGFDVNSFPNYVNIGYRSCDKSFCCTNAVVHTFKKQELPLVIQNHPDCWIRDNIENIKNELIFDFVEDRMVHPLFNEQSASNYVFAKLSQNLVINNFYLHEIVLSYIFNEKCFEYKQDEYVCIDNQCDFHKSMLDIYLRLCNDCCSKNFIARCAAKKVIIDDFRKAPIRGLMVVFGIESHIQALVQSVRELFRSEWQLHLKEISAIHQSVYIFNPNDNVSERKKVIDVVLLKNDIICNICHIDVIAELLFSLNDWRLLWNGNIEYSDLEYPTFRPVSLFPREFSFDLGLSVPLKLKDQFERNFFLTLWLIAGDIITRTELLSTYLPTDRELICYCYRLTYKSFKGPLHRKRAIYIHEKIIAIFVTKYVRVNIT